MGLVRRDSVLNTLITYTGIALGFLNKGLLFPLLLSTEQVGLANVTMLLAGFFAQFSNLGTGMTLIRFLPFFKDKDSGHGGILRVTLLTLLFGIVIMTVTLIVGKSYILSLFEDKSPLLVEYAYWILPAGIAGAFYILFEHYLRALSKNLISVIFQDVVLRLLVLFSIILFWLEVFDFQTFIIVFFCIHLVPAIALTLYLIITRELFLSARYLKIKQRWRKMMVGYGLFVYLNSFGRNIILMADTTMLAAMVGLESVGIYTVMVFLSNALFVPYVALIRVSSPFVSMYWKERNMERMKAMYERVTSIGFFVTFFFFLTVWLNIDAVLLYLPDEYSAGKYVFLFLMIARLFDAVGGINGDILLTSKKFRWEVWITVPLIGLTFYLNYLLIPEYKGVGAAIATAMVYFTYNFVRVILIWLAFKLQPFTMRFMGILLLGGVSTLIGYLMPEMENIWLNVVVQASIPITTFVFPVLLLRLVPEVNEFLGQVSGRLFKSASNE